MGRVTAGSEKSWRCSTTTVHCAGVMVSDEQDEGVYMKASMLCAAVVVSLLATSACTPRRAPGVDPFPGRDRSGATPAAPARGRPEGYARKKVEGKQPPQRLVAKDGTSCTVSEEKYNSTVLGDDVWCTWVDLSR